MSTKRAILFLLAAILFIPHFSYAVQTTTILGAPNGPQTVTGLDDDVAFPTTGSKYLKTGVLQQWMVGKNIVPIGRYSGDLDAAVAALDVAGNAGEDFVIVIDQATAMSANVDLSSLSNASSITLIFLNPAGVITTNSNALTLTESSIVSAPIGQIFNGSGVTGLSHALAEWWWAGSGDIGPAIAYAMAASGYVEVMTATIDWDTGVSMSTAYQQLHVHSRAVNADLDNDEALITITQSRLKITFDGVVTCENTNNSDFIKFNTGAGSSIKLNYITDFRYGIWFDQIAQGNTFTENIIEYNVIYNCTKGVYLSSPPGGQTVNPAEGIELLGGFIANGGTGVHKESGTNGKYWYVRGSIDYNTNDYLDEGNSGNSILNMKWITETTSTFGKGDIIINGRTGTLRLNGNNTVWPPLFVYSTGFPSQVLSGSDVIAYFLADDATATNTNQQITVGYDYGVSSASSNLANLYTNFGRGYATSAKKIGLQQVARRHDDGYASRLGDLEIVRDPGSTNSSSLSFFCNGPTKVAKITSGGDLQLAGSKLSLATIKTPSSATDDGNTGDVCWDADYIYVCTSGTKARGTITMSGVPVEDETFVVGTITYTWKASPSVYTHVLIGADAAGCAANIVTAINDSTPNYIATLSGSTVLVDYYVGGATGNSKTFTESSTNMAVDGTGTLGATTTGVAAWKRSAISTW